MKALSGLAAAAIAVLTAAGIMAALPSAQTGPRASRGHRVTAVVDGDTLRVEDLTGGELGRVRLLGIDAPEVAHPPTPAECYAEEATEPLEQLAPVGSTPAHHRQRPAQPRPVRPDAALRRHADVDVSRELLASGAARRYDSAQELARGDAYAAAEDDA